MTQVEKNKIANVLFDIRMILGCVDNTKRSKGIFNITVENHALDAQKTLRELLEMKDDNV